MHRSDAARSLASRCQRLPETADVAAGPSSAQFPDDSSASLRSFTTWSAPDSATRSRSGMSMCTRCPSVDDCVNDSADDDVANKRESVTCSSDTTWLVAAPDHADRQDYLNTSLNNAMGMNSRRRNEPMQLCNNCNTLSPNRNEPMQFCNNNNALSPNRCVDRATPTTPDKPVRECFKTPSLYQRLFSPSSNVVASCQPTRKVVTQDGDEQYNNSASIPFMKRRTQRCKEKNVTRKSKLNSSSDECSYSTKKRSARSRAPSQSRQTRCHRPTKAKRRLAANSASGNRYCKPCTQLSPMCSSCPPPCPPGYTTCPPSCPTCPLNCMPCPLNCQPCPPECMPFPPNNMPCLPNCIPCPPNCSSCPKTCMPCSPACSPCPPSTCFCCRSCCSPICRPPDTCAIAAAEENAIASFERNMSKHGCDTSPRSPKTLHHNRDKQNVDLCSITPPCWESSESNQDTSDDNESVIESVGSNPELPSKRKKFRKKTKAKPKPRQCLSGMSKRIRSESGSKRTLRSVGSKASERSNRSRSQSQRRLSSKRSSDCGKHRGSTYREHSCPECGTCRCDDCTSPCCVS